MFIWKVSKLSLSKIIVAQLVADTDWFLLCDRVKLTIQCGHSKLLLRQKKKKKEFPVLVFPLYLLLDHSVATGTRLLSHVFFKIDLNYTLNPEKAMAPHSSTFA